MTDLQLVGLKIGDVVFYSTHPNVKGKISYISGGLIDFYQGEDTVMVNGASKSLILKGQLFQKVSYTLLSLVEDSSWGTPNPFSVVAPVSRQSEACLAEIIDMLRKYGKI